MKVLVTGDRGYIGAVMVSVLAELGHEVHGLDTDFYRGCDFGPLDASVPSVRRDVRDVTAAELEPFDAVVHYAALSNDPLGALNPRWTYALNRDATLALARTAKEAGVARFLFASSCSMYGASGTDGLLDESAPLRPLTPYAESKVDAEAGLQRLADADFAPVSMRNATVYGVSPRLRLDIVLNNLTAWAHTTGTIRLLSDGSAWRPLVHVRDVARVAGALLAAPASLVCGQAVNVGSERQNYRVSELAQLVAEASGCAIETSDEATADPRSYRVDFSRLRRILPDLELEWDARRGVEELLAAYRAAGLSRELFEGRRYVRVRQIDHLLATKALDDDLRWRGAEGDGAVRRD